MVASIEPFRPLGPSGSAQRPCCSLLGGSATGKTSDYGARTSYSDRLPSPREPSNYGTRRSVVLPFPLRPKPVHLGRTERPPLRFQNSRARGAISAHVGEKRSPRVIPGFSAAGTSFLSSGCFLGLVLLTVRSALLLIRVAAQPLHR